MAIRRRLLMLLTSTLAASLTASLAAKTPRPSGMTASATSVKLECSVQGAPEDRPDDLYVRNVGNATILKGTRIEWEAVGTTLKGDITLQTDLTPGAGTFAKDLVSGGLEPGHECSCLVASRAGAEAANPVAARRSPLATRLGCVVRGTPAKFPDDLYVLNNGKSPLAKGTTLHWSIPGTDRAGDHLLEEELPPGRGLTLSGVVTGGMPVGVKCLASVK